MSAAKPVQEQYFSWLSKEVTPAQLSELYTVYADIDAFCIQRKILTSKLLDTTDLPTIRNALTAVESNKAFRFKHRHNFRKMISAMRFYYRFVKDSPGLWRKTEENENINSQELNKHSRSEPVATVSKSTVNKLQQRNVSVVDFTSSALLSFTKPFAFSYFGEEQTDIESWAQLYVQVVSCILIDYPNIISNLINGIINGNGRIDFADEINSTNMAAPKKVGDNIYIEANLSATDIVFNMRQILDLCNVDYENLEIRYCKKEMPSQQEDTSAVTNSPAIETPDEIKVNRIQFISWMKDAGYATATIFSYLSAIRQCTKAIQQNGIKDTNLLLLADVTELTQIKEALFAIPAFCELNKQQHDRFHAAFIKLLEFRSKTGNTSAIRTPATDKTESVEKDVSTNECLPSETQSRYANILSKYFGVDGYQPGRAIFLGRFKRNYATEYGCEPKESDDCINSILGQIGTQRDGRIFPKQSTDQNGLIDDIVADVLLAFEDGASAIYIEAIFAKYQRELADKLQIYHAYALTPLLLSQANGKLRQRYSYLVTGYKNADPAEDILRIMKGFHQPQSYDAIHKKAWYIWSKS